MHRIAWLALAGLLLTHSAFAQDTDSAPKSYQPQPGDLLLFRSDSIVMNALAVCTFSVGTTHAAIVVQRRDGTLAILETPYVGADVQFREISERLSSYRGQVWVRHPLRPLTEDQSTRLTEFAYAHLGKGYDFLGFLSLPLSLPTRLQTPDNPIGELRDASRWFCSSLAVGGCCVAGQIDPTIAYPRGACADDLRGDIFLDLSANYAPPLGLRVSGR